MTAADKLGRAAAILEKNSTIVFPLPFDVMRIFDSLARRLDKGAEPEELSRLSEQAMPHYSAVQDDTSKPGGNR